ncbi:AraC-like DNA-binding protein [Rhizobium leguminosarum]|uniref:AraC-like DNA-binding protein n=1 Tax=Rhizobium leguminosarum TaxID=384 RepID=A0AAE2MN24_RHILE|nr:MULTISPECIES: AraC family transcriptional regulator [Rhizobium]MBB4292531.1 AraC-like DNA-binding protein [Rhizobium leguminosarum]MBB4298770.1 AraC-like DNA-binding protein [Rhizobium leguminosarum]MBB4310257.1 AraC-like DNA-binding protein [Rhizobium leguminosarum]MBB4434519.1 AraC-like DNA-binding protein [Rhizobium esperanzae]MBB4531415.1 AraC-like DNA-binding protein [Rhizobium leguminosarum]
MVWLRSQKPAYPRERDYGFTPTHEGGDFESMVQAFTTGYGVFGAKPLHSDRNFAWATDLRASGTLTAVHSVFQSAFEVRTLDETPQHLAFYIPHSGSVRLTVGNRTVEGGAGRILMANNHQAGDRTVQGDQHCSDALLLDWKVVRRTLFSLMETPTPDSIDLEPVVDLATASGRLIGNLAQTIVQGMRNGGPLLSSPLAVSTMSETLADLVIRFGHHRLSGHFEKKKVSAVAPWHVRRAIDYMHANIAEPFTMSMVADQVGISLRALQTGFKAFRGTSPGAYLRTIRLKAVHDQLRDPLNQQTLRDICTTWGFFHPGRFSAIYRSAFGESPRDTRLRAENSPR